ncbi:MAG: M28 family peptidase [Flavobacteriales bacterium]|nr:M28 family peptidase [Flavobacteriales bacterium]MBL0043036.1 M28 family peptidase [Flavobacteriales bacterium]
MPNYRPIFLSIALLGSVYQAVAQNPLVQQIIDEVNIDSLMNDLGLLSGEAPVNVGNGEELIVSRNKNQPGNPLAADWLQQRFEELGYTATVQVFSAGTGENIIAEKTGSLHPERKVVICGHYDAMPGGPVAAPAADDDGSGTVAVLEAARVLAPYTFENTIVFALWDEEEQGKLGSIFYAGVAAGNDVEITGAVNMDAISYDGDGDGLMRVHTKTIANSIALKDSAVMVNALYAGLNLPMAINLPGATYSDHASFWSENYGAILIIEDFDNDGNPHYHTSTDLVDFIDQPYFHGLARLGIGTAAVLAKPVSDPTAILENTARPAKESIFAYPNPTHGTTQVRVTALGGQARLSLHNSLGLELMELGDGTFAPGRHSFSFNAQDLAPGAYVIRFTSGGMTSTFPIVRIP